MSRSDLSVLVLALMLGLAAGIALMAILGSPARTAGWLEVFAVALPLVALWAGREEGRAESR